jgi:beta-galactosidase
VALTGWPAEPPPGEAFLTTRWTTAGDGAWAPAGFEVVALQVPVPSAAPGAPAARPGRPVDASATAPVDEAGNVVHPRLAGPPALVLWRAPTDNDRIGGMAARWRAWGLDRLDRRSVSVERDGPRARVVDELTTRSGIRIRHERAVTAIEGGGLRVDETVELPPELDDLPRVGTVLEVVPGLERLTWYGTGPHETYPDRKRGGLVGRWQTTVSDAATPYIRPQENGGRADVRWLSLTGDDGSGLRVELDVPAQVSATHHRAADLDAATHDVELVARPETIVHIDAAHRGLGTASCGPDTLPEYLVGPGTYRWSWTIVPVGA